MSLQAKIKRIFGKKTVALIAILLFFFAIAVPLGVISPGFEGAKCYGYGMNAHWDGWDEGAYQLHRYQDAEETLLVDRDYILGVLTKKDRVYWTTSGTPNDMGIGFRHETPRGYPTVKEYPQLGIHVESNIQIEDINRQGDPLGWNLSDPSSGRRIEYWSKTATKEETEDKVYYHYTVEKETFIVAPAEFWIGFYLVPSQLDSGEGSGWREGEWNNMVVWFMLDWTVWDNAYKDSWLDDPEVNVFTSEYEGQILNQEKTWDYRGGFPIAGWIQGWEKAGWTSAKEYYEVPQWYDTRGEESHTYTLQELPDLRDKLMAKCSFAPSLVGQFISLYNEASEQFTYEADMCGLTDYSNIDYEDENNPIVSYVKSPDSRMQETMFFPINILNFGTLSEKEGVVLPGWTIFYPSCYFRVRMLYGVYGKFTYLWTEELAKGVVYPSIPEHHGTTVINVPGALSWTEKIGDWFANPFNQLWLMFTALIIVIVVVTFLNPGMWSALALAFTRRKEGRRKQK